MSVLSPLSGVEAGTARDRHEALAAALSRYVRRRFLDYLYGATATPEQIRAAYEPDDYRLLTELKFVTTRRTCSASTVRFRRRNDPARRFRQRPDIDEREGFPRVRRGATL